MAINKKETTKIAMFGAVAGFATPFILQYIVMPILKFLGGIVPAISAKLADPGTLAINVRESLTGLNGGLSGWLADALGISVNVPFQTYIMAAVGGALLFVAGAYVADMFGMLKGNPTQKTRNVVFTGNVIAALILGSLVVPSLNLGFFNVMIAFLINAAIVAFVWVWIDETAKIGLIPF